MKTAKQFLKEKALIYDQVIECILDKYAKDILTEYTNFLLKSGYCDTDVKDELPTAIDRFMHPEIDK